MGGGLKNKAFTLIELLAVIVILVIIALIATPLILNIIEESRKNAFLDSAYGIIDSAKLYYTESLLDGNNGIAKVFSFDTENTELTFGGSKPKGGLVTISKEGKIAIAIHNGNYCARKNEKESVVTLSKYEEGQCISSDHAKDPVITLNGEKDIALNLGEAYTEAGVISKTVDGESLEYTVEITFNGEIVETVDTSQIGVYKITYKAMNNKKIATITKTITIKKNEISLDEIMTDEKAGENGSIRLDNNNNKRYAGSDPNNYVCFGIEGNTCDDNHLYRIIGVFNGQMKLIKNSFYSENIMWSKSDNKWDRSASLNTELNGTDFYENENYIDGISRGYIASGSWGTGGVSSNKTLADFENAETSSSVDGYIGLMSVTDFGYASNHVNCNDNTNLHDSNNVCLEENWLFDNSVDQWTITSYSSYAFYVWQVRGLAVRFSSVSEKYGARPTMFLKTEVKIIDGEGTISNPYILGM